MTRINSLACFFLVSLRLLIGWHFLIEGLHKIHSHQVGKTATNTPWTGEGFFREAIGPFSNQYREFLGLSDRPTLEKLRTNGKQLPAALSAEWDSYFDRFASHYKLDESQKAAVVAKLSDAKAKTAAWLAGEFPTEVKKTVVWGTADVQQTVPSRLAEYDAKVKEIDEAFQSRLPAFNKDVEKTRLRTLKADASRILSDLSADLESRTASMKKDLDAGLTQDQLKLGSVPAVETPSRLKTLDQITMWMHAILGACLLLGLFTRSSCLVLAGFLLQVCLNAPPLPFAPRPPGAIGNYLYIDLYTIELFALLALACMPTGRWFGLDALVHYLFGRKASSAPVAERRKARFEYPGSRS